MTVLLLFHLRLSRREEIEVRTLLSSYKEKDKCKDYIRLEVRNITEIM